MISSAQVRGARAMLRLTVIELSKLADISPNTINRVEAGKSVNSASVKALQIALEAAGVRFIGEGGVVPPAAS